MLLFPLQYRNECLMRLESCRKKRELRVIYSGLCNSGEIQQHNSIFLVHFFMGAVFKISLWYCFVTVEQWLVIQCKKIAKLYMQLHRLPYDEMLLCFPQIHGRCSTVMHVRYCFCEGLWILHIWWRACFPWTEH